MLPVLSAYLSQEEFTQCHPKLARNLAETRLGQDIHNLYSVLVTSEHFSPLPPENYYQ